MGQSKCGSVHNHAAAVLRNGIQDLSVSIFILVHSKQTASVLRLGFIRWYERQTAMRIPLLEQGQQLLTITHDSGWPHRRPSLLRSPNMTRIQETSFQQGVRNKTFSVEAWLMFELNAGRINLERSAILVGRTQKHRWRIICFSSVGPGEATDPADTSLAEESKLLDLEPRQ